MCELGPALEIFEPVQFEENNLGENMAIFFPFLSHLALPFLALTLQNKKSSEAAASIFAPSAGRPTRVPQVTERQGKKKSGDGFFSMISEALLYMYT